MVHTSGISLSLYLIQASMLKKIFALCSSLLLCSQLALAQTATPTRDSIYNYADFMPIPMMRACEQLQDSTWTVDTLRDCGLYQLNALIAKELRYPHEAVRDSIQGRVILSFVIDTTGVMSDWTIVKDIGGGCGAEAVRMFRDMTVAGLRWVPAMHLQKRVPLRMMWPIKFAIRAYTPPVSYTSDSGIEVYTEPDSVAYFNAGEEALLQYITERLDYPAAENDSCRVGVMEFSLLIMPDQTIEIEHMVDFSGLGLDYQWEAIKMLNSSKGLWTPGQYKGKAVPTVYPLRVLFKSDAAVCKAANKQFDASIMLHADGLAAYDAENYDLAITKYTEALAITPRNTEFLYFRGSSYASKGNTAEACKDYTAIKNIIGKVWFQHIYQLMCTN
jgi:periplasmic protein TonB